MKNENPTEAIFQKIVSDNNIENKPIKNVAPAVKPPKQQKSVYDNIIDHIEKNKIGEEQNGTK